MGSEMCIRDSARVGLEPLRERVALAVREQGDRLAAFQIDEHRAIRVAFAQRPVIDPQDSGRRQDGQRLPAQAAQQGVPAHPYVPRVAEVHPSRPAERHAEGHEALSEPQRAPRPGGGHRGQPFGEDTPPTAGILTKPLADTQLEAHPIVRPGKVRQGAPVVTMDAPCWGGAPVSYTHLTLPTNREV